MQKEDVCTHYAMTGGPVTEPAIQDPDRFAWRTFCELNQPAPGKGRRRIWQTWANQFDVFVSRPDPKHPPTWAGATGSTRLDRMQKRVELLAALLARNSSSSDSSSSITDTSTTDTSGLSKFPAPRYDANDCDPDTTQQVYLNRAQFDYVVSNDLWYVEGQIAAFRAQKTIELPTDATTVKVLWRPITEAEKPKYYWTVSEGKLYGLASFLFMSKVIPTWTWASFEHIDNPCFARYEAPEDNFGVTAAGKPSRALLQLFHRFGLDTALWSHYRLTGIQTSFTNNQGRPVLLGNSIAEDGFQTTSSCTTCHARSTVGAATTDKVLGAGRLRIFNGFYTGNARPQSASGAPDPSLYYDFSKTPPALKYLPMDFAWSFACANNIGSDSNPCEATSGSTTNTSTSGSN